MASTYGFFNSLNGDRTYNADQMSEYFKGLVSDGVYENVGGALQVLARVGMDIGVQSGRAIIDCKWFDNDGVTITAISAAHATLNRWTAVILRLSYEYRYVGIATKDGTPATNPAQPTMENSETTKELCLAMIYVPAGATSITQANITDMRPSSMCGWVTGLVQQVDTSKLFLQWQSAYQAYYDEMTAQFDAWLSALTEQLQVNTCIEEYEKREILNGSASNIIPLNMDGYSYENTDIFQVFFNGLMTSENYDWYLDTTAKPVRLHCNLPNFGKDVVNVKILKSKIGFASGKTHEVGFYNDDEEVEEPDGPEIEY